MDNIVFKTDLLRGAKGERGEAGVAESVPSDGVIAFVGETTPQGYEEITPADVFTQIYADIDAVNDKISNEYDPTETYNAGDYCIYDDTLYKCNTNATTGVWDANKWDATNVGEELVNVGEETKATVEDIISDAYDATATYAVGDYCIYNDTLYKCNTAIVTGEAFTPAKWDATNVAEEIQKKLQCVEIPYSSFSWDSNTRAFKYSSPSIDVTTIKGFIITPLNGQAILGGYYSESLNAIYVMGWVPSGAETIDSDWRFKCFVVY